MSTPIKLSGEDLKKLHNIDLEMISEVDRICRKKSWTERMETDLYNEKRINQD